MVELAPTEWDALLARAGMALFAEALADPRRGVDLPGALPVEFAHRDDYYRRSLRRRNVPAPRRSVSAPGANSSVPAGTGAAPGANSPAPTRSQSAAGRNVPASRRTTTTPPVRWSARHPGSAS